MIRLRRVRSAPRSIRQRLGWLLGAVSVGTLLVVNLAWLPGAIRELREAQAELQRIAVRGARDQIQFFLEDKEHALMAQAMLLRLPYLEGDPAELRLLGQHFLLQELAFEEIGIIDAGGVERFRLSRTLAFTDRDLRDRSGDRLFRDAIQQGTAWGKVVTAETSVPRVTLGVRLRRSEKASAGVVFGVLNLKSLWELTERTTLSRGGRTYVVDERGRLIAADDPNLVLKQLSFADRPLVQRLVRPAGSAPLSPLREAYTNEHAARVMATGLPVPEPRWGVVVEQPQALLYAPILGKLWFALTLSFGGLVGSIGLARLVSRRFTGSITRLREEVRQFGEGHLERRIAIHTGDEIAELAGQFNRMADQVAASHRDLERKVAEKTRDLSALYAVTGPIGRASDLNAVMDEAAGKILTVTGVDAASVRLLDATGTRISVATYRAFPQAYIEAQAPIGQFNRMGREVLRTGQPVIVSDLVEDPVYGQGPLVRNGYRSAACLPLVASGAPLGVMTLAARRPGQISPGQREIFAAIGHQIAVAIENARLFQQEQERRQQLEVVRAVTGEIARELDLTKLLELIHRRAVELVGATRGVMWIWDAEDQVLVPRAWYGHDDSFSAARVRLGQGCTGMVAQQRTGMIVNDYQAWPHANPLFRDRSGVRAVLSEPLLYRDRLVGVISVESLEEDRPFTDQHGQALALFADQAAIAIENARLFNQEQERRRQVEAVRAVAEEIARELDLSALLGLITRRASELVGATSGVVLLWDEAAQALVPGAWHGYGDWMGNVSYRIGEGLSGTVAQRREGMILNDYRISPLANPVLLERTPITAALAEPLLYRGRLLGAITLNNESDHPFTEADREVLALFAGQAAIAIGNARLHEGQRAAARSAEAQRARAEALAAVGQALAASLELDQVLTLMVERTTAAAGADAVAVLQRDPATGALHFRRASGLSAAVEREALPAGMGIAGAALAAGRPMWTEDLRIDPRFSAPGHVLPLVAQEGVRAVLCVPIRGHEAPYGVLSLYRRAVHTFTEEEIDFAVRIADQAAIAIENARLFQEEQRRRRQVEAVRAVTEEITRELDLAALLKLIARRAAELSKTTSSVIYVWDEGDQVLVPRAWHGFAEWIRDLRLRLGEGLAGAAAQRRERVQVDDYRTSPYAVPRVLKHIDMTTALAEPLLHHGRLVGVILITNQGSERRFSEQDYAILSLFASQAVIAIENARLYEQVGAHAETLERRVRERTAELEKANRAKSEFLANMSHELRTPLNAVIGFAQMLAMKSFGPLTPKQDRYVTNIQNGGVHLLNLVNDILDLAKVEAGRLELRRERVMAGDAVAQALEVVGPQAEGKGLRLAAEVAEDLPPLHADPIRMRQILVNLLANAVKFTEAGGRVTVRARAEGTWVEVQVADTGIGVAPEDLQRLFRKFEQLHSGPAKAHQGTGLGLALTKHLVELHGGTIGVASPGRGQGATFTVRLPAGPGRERPRILVVEDDAVVRQNLLDAAALWGWEATPAVNLAAARTALEAYPPDLLLLDSSLPDGSGVDFVGDVRSRPGPRLPILVYTGLGAEEAQAAMAAGADEYLVKPAPLEAVHRKAAALLARAGWPVIPPGPGPQDAEGPVHDVTPSPAATPGG